VEVKYQQEFLSHAEQEVTPLAELEWEESGHPTHTLVIDWDSYFALEKMGRLKFFTARKEGLLVGYFVVIITSPFTTKGELVGCYEAVYVHKDYRKSMVARRMFKFVEDCMKEDGIYRVVASSSAKNPIGNFLNRMGYDEVETKYEKVL
jgi:GNAT superfamily N-acetyltransferase